MSGEQIKFYYYNTQSQFEANQSSIPESAIVFVGDEDDPAIWTHGVEFKGGAKKEPEPVIPTYNLSAIKYKVHTTAPTAVYDGAQGWSSLPSNTTSLTWTLTGQPNWFTIQIPSNYTLISAKAVDLMSTDYTSFPAGYFKSSGGTHTYTQPGGFGMNMVFTFSSNNIPEGQK